MIAYALHRQLRSTAGILRGYVVPTLELGTLEVGKVADLVAVTGTDLEVTDLRSRVARVVQAGREIVL